MFTKFELDTIIIMVLNINSSKWFTKETLYNEVLTHYEKNPTELYYGHFLFVWSKLLINYNFIIVHESGEKIKIDTKNAKDVGPFEDFINVNNSIIHDMNLQVQLNHMVEFPKLYTGSVLIKKFLLNYYNCDLFFKFFELYQDSIILKENIINNTPSSGYLNFTNNSIIPVSVMSLIIMGYYYWIKK